MYFEGVVASEISKLETKRAERSATERWRFRHLKTKESKVLTTIVTSMLQLFLR